MSGEWNDPKNVGPKQVDFSKMPPRKCDHRFGGPSTDGTTHCFKCGAIRDASGNVTENTTPLPAWAS